MSINSYSSVLNNYINSAPKGKEAEVKPVQEPPQQESSLKDKKGLIGAGILAVTVAVGIGMALKKRKVSNEIEQITRNATEASNRADAMAQEAVKLKDKVDGMVGRLEQKIKENIEMYESGLSKDGEEAYVFKNCTMLIEHNTPYNYIFIDDELMGMMSKDENNAKRLLSANLLDFDAEDTKKAIERLKNLLKNGGKDEKGDMIANIISYEGSDYMYRVNSKGNIVGNAVFENGKPKYMNFLTGGKEVKVSFPKHERKVCTVTQNMPEGKKIENRFSLDGDWLFYEEGMQHLSKYNCSTEKYLIVKDNKLYNYKNGVIEMEGGETVEKHLSFSEGKPYLFEEALVVSKDKPTTVGRSLRLDSGKPAMYIENTEYCGKSYVPGDRAKAKGALRFNNGEPSAYYEDFEFSVTDDSKIVNSAKSIFKKDGVWQC